MCVPVPYLCACTAHAIVQTEAGRWDERPAAAARAISRRRMREPEREGDREDRVAVRVRRSIERMNIKAAIRALKSQSRI